MPVLTVYLGFADAVLGDFSDATTRDTAGDNPDLEFDDDGTIPATNYGGLRDAVDRGGSINSLVFGARGRSVYTGGGNANILMTWKLGAVTASDPALGFPSMVFSTQRGAPVLTRPGGGAWTWADVAALTNMGWSVAYHLPPRSSFFISVAEAFVEVNYTRDKGPVAHLGGLLGAPSRIARGGLRPKATMGQTLAASRSSGRFPERSRIAGTLAASRAGGSLEEF